MIDNKFKVLITGSCGFIGFHLSNYLLSKGFFVIGIDGMTNYYDVSLKSARNKILKQSKKYTFIKAMINEGNIFLDICKKYNPNIIIHLAAQAGVRYSIDFPDTYFESNISGTYKILETIKKIKIDHLILASTSSVYGSNNSLPFNENQKCDKPISFYSATKISTESLSHSYSHLYNIPTTILRFFTVYGPWGRPDMALFKFTKSILSGDEIEVFNNGMMKRDFTYIDDVVKSIFLLINKAPKIDKTNDIVIKNDSLSAVAPFRIINIGNSQSINLLDYIKIIENCLNLKAKMKLVKLQDGDIVETFSDCSLLFKLTGFSPQTSVEKGVLNFVEWYKKFYLNS